MRISCAHSIHVLTRRDRVYCRALVASRFVPRIWCVTVDNALGYSIIIKYLLM